MVSHRKRRKRGPTKTDEQILSSRCQCGSGKMYKNCCYERVEAKAAAIPTSSRHVPGRVFTFVGSSFSPNPLSPGDTTQWIFLQDGRSFSIAMCDVHGPGDPEAAKRRLGEQIPNADIAAHLAREIRDVSYSDFREMMEVADMGDIDWYAADDS